MNRPGGRTVEIIRKLVKADRDGVIHLDLSLAPGLEYEVVVVCNPAPPGMRPAAVEDPEERVRVLSELVGAWQGEFEGFRDESKEPSPP